ncbi:NAD(P)H oxidoreductase [Billgrantia pellis]|uniref:NAD(P)H oxidoreductase n=1 Tax=Billgrantia pellis TaxID=2606936 RepID=A0A7V7G0N8_9GAMM|nr:NAD(P)H oxidoreductase [Halomonas pellis]KAA0012971.1 NAD(P)H oxidoreductase [Halomonas pellis]
MKQVQMIWAHPRPDSLTARVAQTVRTELEQHGWSVADLDLYRTGFNPVLGREDEPEWTNPEQKYSDEVMRLADDLMDKQAAFIVFPVWWFSTPAILKGYIDRVWNYGLFYGRGTKLPFDSIRWIALAGTTHEAYAKIGLDDSMADLLNVGIAEFCGVTDSQVTLLHDTLGEEVEDLEAHHEQLIEHTRQVVADWAKLRR